MPAKRGSTQGGPVTRGRVLSMALLLGLGGGAFWVNAQEATPTTLPAAPTLSAPAVVTPALLPPAVIKAPDTTTPDTTAPATAPAAPTGPTAHEIAGRCIEGSEQACMALSRQGKDGKERKILVVRTGTSDDTGIYTVCGARDDDPEGTPNLGIFSETGAGGIRITIDKNVIQVPLAIVTQAPPKDGEDGSDGRVEASAGTARFLENVPEGAKDRLSLCGIETAPKPAPDTVIVSQGQTQLRGQKLLYDGADGIARIDGPITFKRDNATDPLSGTSDQIEVNVDDEKTLLVGNVTLTSKGGRISKAARVEYDDTANIARLYATPEQPAESRKGSEWIKIESGYIYYNLTTNEVWAGTGKITGEFPDSSDGTSEGTQQK